MADPKKNTVDPLLVSNFSKNVPIVSKLSDPLVDTPMLITIDQLKPYEHNPRKTRNPKYDELKESIRKRGLDTPPPITRRPGASHFIIRNGGNTRLSILNELWDETKDEKFFKIHCLFRPWQSEIVTLTGHLAEGELHGRLTFIERALGIIKAGEFYQEQSGVALSQRQLAQKLTSDGYPISQTTISQIQDVVNYLLPVIPDVLYAGLSRKQIEKILCLRRTARNVWLKHSDESPEQTYTFDEMFIEVLSLFNDITQKELDMNKYQDELTGRIAQVFECSYDLIELEFHEKEKRQRQLETKPQNDFEIDEQQLFVKNNIVYQSESEIDEKEILSIPSPKLLEPRVKVTRTVQSDQTTVNSTHHNANDSTSDVLQLSGRSNQQDREQFINAHIVSPIENTERLENLQEMVSELTGEILPDFEENVLKSIPVQVGGLYPISDLWHISSYVNNAEQLRVHIGQLVLEIAEEQGCANAIETTDEYIGFNCIKPDDNTTNQTLLCFLYALIEHSETEQHVSEEMRNLVRLLIGGNELVPSINALSDISFVKLIRVLRLIRRFFELQR